ncbi:MAG: tandem-95 repeat protein [Hyphomicrobium sp.]|nr:tandem-95 repeat protein [Hyphomicrobium sp.]
MATITGTNANDVITGTTANDIIDGGAGNDRINGGAGDDVIFGGDGTDTLTGDAGNDTLYGGNGNDGFFGGGGNDTLYGEAGDDTMYGDGGNDRIVGGDGNDKLYGGTGDDELSGGAGNNIVDGGAGIDTVVIELSSATLNDAMRADLATLKTWMQNQLALAGSTTALGAQTTGPALVLSALGLTLSNFEVARIYLDGVEKPIGSFLNVAPVAAALVNTTTNEDNALSGTIVASDADGDVLSFAVTAGPANGSLTLNAATGAYVYTPSANYNGADSFQVTVVDPKGAAITQTVNVAIAAVNDAPVAVASVDITTNEDTTVLGTVVASDVDGDVLSYAVAAGPANGSLTLNAETGAYIYTPNADFNGADSFQVAVVDPKGAAIMQTVNVAIAAVNDAPVAEGAVEFKVEEDNVLYGDVGGSDVDGDALAWALTSKPENGTVKLDETTGKYAYIPNADYNGSDTFEVSVTDASGVSTTQTVKITVVPVNDAPVTASVVELKTNEDTVVSGQVVASDVDGDALAWALTTKPANGSVKFDATTGAYSYVPKANFNGTDSFAVTVTDPSGAATTQTIKVSVVPVNDAPVVAANASLTTQEDKTVQGSVAASDVENDALSWAVSRTAGHGGVKLDGATGAYTYIPNANYNGSDSFEVTVTDQNGAKSSQTITVTITPVNDAPVTQATSAVATIEDKSVSGMISATDVDGDALTWSLATSAARGTVALNAATGAYTYTPTANASGADFFLVNVKDAYGATAQQRVDVTVSAVADQPTLTVVSPVIIPEVPLPPADIVAILLAGTGEDDQWDNVTVALNISSSLVDTDGSEALALRITDVPAGGTLSAGLQNSDGSWSLTQADLAGLTITTDKFATYTIKVQAIATEATGGSASSTQSITIQMDSQGVTLSGNNGANTLNGGFGNDKLYGNGGNDTLNGGAGADRLEGGKGNDYLYGGSGNDHLFGQAGDDFFFGEDGNDVYSGGSGYDTLSYASANSAISADLGKKIIVGADTGTDTIKGAAIEKIIGTSFADTFNGSSGVDRVDGGGGNDYFRGFAGSDIFTGGAGADKFYWDKADVGSNRGVDHITDFGAGDVLDFTGLVTLGSGSLADYVRLSVQGNDTTISAKIGSAFVAVAVLDSVKHTSVTDLYNGGHLLVA